jgi:hypothetical protein
MSEKDKAWLTEACPKLSNDYTGSIPTYPQVYKKILNGEIRAVKIGRQYEIDLQVAAKVFGLTAKSTAA